MKLSLQEVSDQRAALLTLARLTQKAILAPRVRQTALALTADCDSRDDLCEIQAVFNAIKHGDDRIPGLARGVRYVADPRQADAFTAPDRMLELIEGGARGGDCDDLSALIAALLGAVGFRVGLRAWGRLGSGEYTHVYSVVGFPKRKPDRTLGLDATVAYSDVGWEPPRGDVLTAWLE